MTSSWFDRLTDFYADFDLMSLAVILFAVVMGFVVNHVYFRARLEPAVDAGVAPRLVKLEALSLALTAGALIAGFSGWGFLWIFGVFILAGILVFMSGERKLIGLVAGALVIAVLFTLLGIKLNAL